MSRQRLDPEVAAEEERVLRTLRPQRLDECIGQTRVIEGLRISIDAACGRSESLDHVLLHGPPGLGKTTLASVVAREMGAQLVGTSGPALERGGDLMGILTNLNAGDILFIDEIHRLSRGIEELLYPAMEDFCVNFVLDKGQHARTLRYQLRPFTLVGATTRAGLLSSPLRERFGIFHHLDFFTTEDLTRVVLRSAGILQVPVEPGGAEEIACRSRGTPRIANRLLRRVRDYAQVRAGGVVTQAVAREALEFEGVDHLGLDGLDRDLLRTLIQVYGGGPAGIEALAASLHEDIDTLEEVVEPYLLKAGLIARTPGGRRATSAAYAHLGLAAPEGRGQGSLWAK